MYDSKYSGEQVEELLDKVNDLNNTGGDNSSCVQKTDENVQHIVGGLIIGSTDTPSAMQSGKHKGRIMLTGVENPLVGVQAKNGTTPYYVQAHENNMYVGPARPNATSFDNSGNVTMPNDLSVANNIYEGGKALSAKYVSKGELSSTELAISEYVPRKINEFKETLAEVAKTGKYEDLVDKPTFKTINGHPIVGSGDLIFTGSGSSDIDFSNYVTSTVLNDAIVEVEDSIASQITTVTKLIPDIKLKNKSVLNDSRIFNLEDHFKTINGNSILGSGDIDPSMLLTADMLDLLEGDGLYFNDGDDENDVGLTINCGKGLSINEETKALQINIGKGLTYDEETNAINATGSGNVDLSDYITKEEFKTYDDETNLGFINIANRVSALKYSDLNDLPTFKTINDKSIFASENDTSLKCVEKVLIDGGIHLNPEDGVLDLRGVFTSSTEEQYKGTITAVELGEEIDNPELGYATKEEVNESLLGKIDRTEVQEKFDELEEGLSELGSKVNSLDIQLESYEYVNIMSNQTVLSDIGGNGLQYIVKQGDVLFQASKVGGVGKDVGDYYYVNFQLNSGVFWKKNHQYYCAIDVLANSNISDTFYLSTDAKFNNPNIVSYYVSKTKIPTGQRGWVKNLIEVNKEETIELYPNANRLFVSFWHKIYPNDVFDIKIYNIILIDLGIPGTEYYKSWEEVDIIFSQGTKEYSVSTARLAHKLKVGNIECWGDSLTAQNYGKYVQGANVYTYGFGGKSSTYIRDEFLSKANKDVTQVVWVGRNNSTETDVVIDDIRDIVSALSHNNFIVMCPPNGYYGEFGTNGADGTGEMKGGNAHSKFLELERRLSEEYPSNFLNIRKAIIEGWRMGNVRLLSDFTQPSVGSNVTIEVSDATYLTTYNSYDLDKFGQDFMTKIRIGVNGMYDVYKIIEKVDDTHLTVQLEESNRITVGSTVGNITDSGGNSAVKYLRVIQNADYMCWLYDTTPSTFRKDGIHMTEDGLKLVAQVVSRKLTAMKLL